MSRTSNTISARPKHPGSRVREAIIPIGMSVSEAARRLGIGRPALSSFLNGRSALSPKMAVRLEKAFGANREELLDLQQSYNRRRHQAMAQDVAVVRQVPEFLAIKARRIERWGTAHIRARAALPVLIRKLVHSTIGTPSALRRIDFPGYDNGQRRGPDGIVEAQVATPWIPSGKSIWELGTGNNPQRKAESDYGARLRSVDAATRAETTFIVVTTRNWHGKGVWARSKEAAGEWKAVRAYDASDLEQWLEQSLPAQMWFAKEFGLPVLDQDYETLDQAWQDWADVTDPPLTANLFEPWLDEGAKTFLHWFRSKSTRPFVIAANSRDEAFAFLACLLEIDNLRALKDLTAILTSPRTAKQVIRSSAPLIAIASSVDVERAVSAARHPIRHVIYRPPNVSEPKPDISLGLLPYDAFKQALMGMSINEGRVEQLERESGRSVTILRRRLSQNPSIRQPVWADDDQISRGLMPLALIGSWQVSFRGDKETLSRLADQQWEALETRITTQLNLEDSPVWSILDCQGFTSRIDALFATAPMITSAVLERFFEVSEQVLLEPDPVLELPVADRWEAVVNGNVRSHSETLRKGICETLILLAVHGGHLVRNRLPLNPATAVQALVQRILTPLTINTLLSLEDVLPLLAEAAPEVFLEVLGQDLDRDVPELSGLLRSSESDEFWQPEWRTSLLEALECLACNAEHLPSAALLLARLSSHEVADRDHELPTSSLHAIFNAWSPQTAATVEDRIATLDLLRRRFPRVAWTICMKQLENAARTAHDGYRPRWRDEAPGAKREASSEDRIKFVRRVVERVFQWSEYDEHTLADLVEHLGSLQHDKRRRVWDLIDDWSLTATESAKAALRERIRRAAMTPRGRLRSLGPPTIDRARQTYAALRPSDPVARHKWLFRVDWIEVSADDAAGSEFNPEKNSQTLNKLRRRAIREIYDTPRSEGITRLLAVSGSPYTIGRSVAMSITDSRELGLQVSRLLALGPDSREKAETCIEGLLTHLPDNSVADLLQNASQDLSSEEQARLFAQAPFRRSTWRLVDTCGPELRTRYWRTVDPTNERHSPAGFAKLIGQLLDAGRPEAAFRAVTPFWQCVETSLLKRLMHDLATVISDPRWWDRGEGYEIATALKALNGRQGVRPDEMARLEFRFIDALVSNKDIHGLPHLEERIAGSPAAFAALVARCSKRSDSGEDPPECRVADADRRKADAWAAHQVLDELDKIPGTDPSGQIHAEVLAKWLGDAQRECDQLGHRSLGDAFMGNLLSKAPIGPNAGWPCEAVCEAIEEVASRELGTGFVTGALNSRGPVLRGQGGQPERELAERYDAWAKTRRFAFPFVAGLLKKIAESYRSYGRWWDSEGNLEDRQV